MDWDSNTFSKISEYNKKNDTERDRQEKRKHDRSKMNLLEKIEDSIEELKPNGNGDIQCIVTGASILIDVVPLLLELDGNCAVNCKLIEIGKFAAGKMDQHAKNCKNRS